MRPTVADPDLSEPDARQLTVAFADTVGVGSSLARDLTITLLTRTDTEPVPPPGHAVAS